MFEHLLESLRGFSARLGPEERHRVISSMRDAMVHARLAIDDMRKAMGETNARLAEERGELDTVLRRRGLAEGIGDTETVSIADRFAGQHRERIRVLEVKLMAQEQELELGEREYEEMKKQLRQAMSGVSPSSDARARQIEDELESILAGRDAAPGSGDTADPAGWPHPVRTRAERERDAEEKLAELKRRMGR